MERIYKEKCDIRYYYVKNVKKKTIKRNYMLKNIDYVAWLDVALKVKKKERRLKWQKKIKV